MAGILSINTRRGVCQNCWARPWRFGVAQSSIEEVKFLLDQIDLGKYMSARELFFIEINIPPPNSPSEVAFRQAAKEFRAGLLRDIASMGLQEPQKGLNPHEQQRHKPLDCRQQNLVEYG
jgi:hypothetical protein